MTIERLLEAGRALDAGELDRAEQTYRQVAEADPRSSIAVVGLARVALRRGAAAEAVRLATAALSIDPGNAAARRLVEAVARPVADHPAPATPAPATPAPATPALATPAPATAAPATPGAQAMDPEPDSEWPWPDLQEQVDRYREPAPGLLGRLLRRGRRE